jgi:hypothetical protein
MIERMGSPLRLYCKEHNIPSVQALYRGYPVLVESVTDDSEVLKKKDSRVLDFHRTVRKSSIYKTFDEEIYAEAGIKPYVRWSSFKFNPPYSALPVTLSEYAFVHEDFERGYLIEPVRSGKNLINCKNVFKPNKNTTKVILDYFLLILNADEVHVIDSSFRILADQLYSSEDFLKFRTNEKTPKLLYHRYARKVEEDGWHVPSVRYPSWETVY